jgi:hypothetical protein
MPNKPILEEMTEEEKEIWQFVHSVELAEDFLSEELLPQLEEFETNNEDSDYVFGTTTHGLFIEMIMRLGAMGYTEKELRKEIKTWINTSIGQTLH